MKLATRDLAVEHVKPDWRLELLAVITNPTVAYGLLLIGIYGLLLEGYNPGVVLPGVVGAICLLVALFAFQILSVNYAGLALVALGVGMMVAEFFFPTFGSLGPGRSHRLRRRVAHPVRYGYPRDEYCVTADRRDCDRGRSRRLSRCVCRRPLHAPPGRHGSAGDDRDNAEVLQAFSGTGRVRYRGELWNARRDAELQAGQMARIVKVEGLTLWVEPR